MKPIFVCRLPINNTDFEDIDTVRFHLKEELLEDYHVLVLTDNTEEVKFELYNSELEDKDFEDLKLKLNL